MRTKIAGIKEMTEKLDALQKKRVPAAIAAALNDTIYGASQDVKKEMLSVFDRPTAAVLRGLRFTKASSGTLAARLYLAGERDSSLNVSQILEPHVYGGQRVRKASERRLRRVGVMRQDQWIVPGPAAPLDAHGNITGQTMVKILAQIQAFTEAGFNANSKLRGMTWKRYKQLGSLYVIKNVGVFSRKAGGGSEAMLLFVSAPQYKGGKFDLPRVTRDHAKTNFAKNFRAELRAIST